MRKMILGFPVAIMLMAASAQAQGAVWSATFTPGDINGYAFGCQNGDDDAECSNKDVLSDDTFTVGEIVYTVTEFYQTSGTNRLYFAGIRTPEDGTSWVDIADELKIGSTSLDIGDAFLSQGQNNTSAWRLRWSGDPGLDDVLGGDSLTDGTSISVTLISGDLPPPPPPPTTPGAPTGLAATANGPSQIDLAWTAPASTGGSAITGYKIEVSPDGSSWSDLVADTGSTDTAYAHMGLDPATTRHYRVSAINAVGTSNASDSDDTTTASTNTAPTFTEGTSTTRSVAENTASGQNIGAPVTATDTDTSDTLTYTLGGTDAADFGIVRSSGQLQTSAALDFETKDSYAVTVSVSDGNGGADSINVTINVTNVDEPNFAPTFNEGTSTTRSVAENTASGQNIGAPVTATDTDTSDTLTYTLGGTDAADFGIVRSSGQLQTSAALDFETKDSYAVTVSVSDGNGGADSIDVTINVTNVDEPNFAPTFNEGTSTTRSVAENTASGQNIGAPVTATDTDTSDTLTYTLGGTDAADFGIVRSSGQLQTSAALDFETKDSYAVTVSVSDGNGGADSIDVTINVTNVDEPNFAPTFNEGTSTTRSVAENTASGQNIGAPVTATDTDTSDTLTYTLGGTDAADFGIVRSSGQLQTSAALDFETKDSYAVTVSVSDGNGGADSIDVTINVTADRAALVALYNATGGADWTNNTNWLSNEALSEWHRVETDEDGRVTALRLVANELSGEIPAVPLHKQLGNLTNLEDAVSQREYVERASSVNPVGAVTTLGVGYTGDHVVCAGEYCISGVAGNDRFPGDRLRPSTATSAAAATSAAGSAQNGAGRAHESTGGGRRRPGRADLGCAGRRRRRGDHGLRVPDRPAGRLDFHRFHRHHPYGYRPRQRHDLRLSGAGAQPDRQEWSFPAGRGDANSAGGFRLGAFCQRGQHHLRSSACECGPPSDPARSLLLRSRRRADRSGIDGGCPGRSGDPRGRGADDPDGDGAAGRTHDLDPRPGRPGEWIGEGGRLWGHRRGPAF